MHQINKETGNIRGAWSFCIPAVVLVILLWWTRYALAPATDFTVDDWSFYYRATKMEAGEIWSYSLRDAVRPVTLGTLLSSFKLLGENLAAWAFVRTGLVAVFMLSFLWMSWVLTRSRFVMLVSGIFLSLCPNLYQSFYWHCHEVMLFAPILYLWSITSWLKYSQNGAAGWLALSIPFFLLAVFSYEYGVMLSILYPIIAWESKAQRSVRKKSMIFPCLAVFYALWRLTAGFGWGMHALSGSEYFCIDFSPVLLMRNTLRVVSWWIGSLMGQSVVNGWSEFGLLPSRHAWAILALNAALAAAVYRASRRCAGDNTVTAGSHVRIQWLVAAGIFILPYVPHVLFPASARHNLFPAVGAALIAAMGWEHWKLKCPGWIIVVLLTLIMAANQGNGLSWKRAAAFQRRLYKHLEHSQSEWESKKIVFFDTESLRHRLSRDLKKSAGKNPRTWTHYRTGALLRGFALQSMIDRIRDRGEPIRAVMDTEHGACIENNVLHWHARYDPTRARKTAAEQIYRIDVLSSAGDIR